MEALRATIEELPGTALAHLLGELEGLKARAWSRLVTPTASAADGWTENNASMTAGELAAIYRVPKSWFYEMARRGRLPHTRLGHYVRFNRADVEQELLARRSESRIRTS